MIDLTICRPNGYIILCLRHVRTYHCLPQIVLSSIVVCLQFFLEIVFFFSSLLILVLFVLAIYLSQCILPSRHLICDVKALVLQCQRLESGVDPPCDRAHPQIKKYILLDVYIYILKNMEFMECPPLISFKKQKL
jgi:hypothetical protein